MNFIEVSMRYGQKATFNLDNVIYYAPHGQETQVTLSDGKVVIIANTYQDFKSLIGAGLTPIEAPPNEEEVTT